MNKKGDFVCTKGWDLADEKSFDGTREEVSRAVVGWERAVQAAEAEKEDEKSSDMICAQHRGHQRGKGAKE